MKTLVEKATLRTMFAVAAGLRPVIGAPASRRLWLRLAAMVIGFDSVSSAE